MPDKLVDKKDFPRPLKFLHYEHPVLGAVCIDKYCERHKEEDPHAHPIEQQTYE